MSKQVSLFDVDPDWRKDWMDMPEFEHKNLEPEFQVTVSFDSYEDLRKFGELVKQNITKKTISIWYPAMTVEKAVGHKRYADREPTREECAESIGEAMGEAGREADEFVYKEMTKGMEFRDESCDEPEKDAGPSALEYLMGGGK